MRCTRRRSKKPALQGGSRRGSLQTPSRTRSNERACREKQCGALVDLFGAHLEEVFMKALTLHAPWAWAIAHAGKRIENRSWRPPAWSIGQRIAIHAGRNLGDADSQESCRDLIEEVGVDPPQTWPRSLIVCTAIVAGFVESESARELSAADAAWYCGPVGWRLRDIQTVEPIACKGALGLWNLPQTVAASLGPPLTAPSRDGTERERAREEGAPQGMHLAECTEILFELKLERHAPGSHIGGRHGTVVRCPRCQRSACRIDHHRYAHELRLLQCMSPARGLDGKRVLVRDVRSEWGSVCISQASAAEAAP